MSIMEGLVPYQIQCPNCGEEIEILVDTSVSQQQYVEDCQVCCRPILLDAIIDSDGIPQVTATSENE